MKLRKTQKKIKKKFQIYGGRFDITSKLNELKEKEDEMAKPTFWDDKEKADLTLKDISELKNLTQDIKKLIEVLNRIADRGTTVIAIEHNLDFIKCADYIIDIGPDGGKHGGEVIATGTPEQILKYADISYTAKYLKKVLEKNQEE